MMLTFNDAETLFEAVRHHEAYMRDGHTTLSRETATKVIDAAKKFGGFFLEENVKTFCFPLDALNAMILDAEIDGDEDLAERLRRDKADVELHIARRIVDALRGKTTNLARAMKASLIVGGRAKRDAEPPPEPILGPEHSYPSDHIGQGARVVPLNGKAGA